jgi:hypothetical protein
MNITKVTEKLQYFRLYKNKKIPTRLYRDLTFGAQDAKAVARTSHLFGHSFPQTRTSSAGWFETFF